MTDDKDLYSFFKEFKKAAGTKVELGWGLVYGDGSLNPQPFLKLKIIDKKKYDLGVFATKSQDLGFLAGVKIMKAGLKINLGVCTRLAKKIKLSDVKVKGFMGFSFSF